MAKVKKVKGHPFLKQFGKETARLYGYAAGGAVGGAGVGAGVGALAGGKQGAKLGALVGGHVGSYGGAIKGHIENARSAEKLRKSLGIGGKKITGLRQYIMPGSIRLAYRHHKATAR